MGHGSWVMGHGSWVNVGHGSWVMGQRWSWVIIVCLFAWGLTALSAQIGYIAP